MPFQTVKLGLDQVLKYKRKPDGSPDGFAIPIDIFQSAVNKICRIKYYASTQLHQYVYSSFFTNEIAAIEELFDPKPDPKHRNWQSIVQNLNPIFLEVCDKSQS